MGIVRNGPPAGIVCKLKSLYNISTFVETGTYLGGTALWASKVFERVITIEASEEIYRQTRQKYEYIGNIKLLFGDSRKVLAEVVSVHPTPAVFWLDAHWSGGETYGEDDECPLIEEIHAINISEYDHFIFIDDARLFTSPPPRPHRIEHWPSIDQVIEAIKSGNQKYYIVLIEDVIIAVPEYAKESVASYCQEINTQAWEEYGERLNESATKRGFRLIGQGLRSIGHGLRIQLRCLATNLIASVIHK